MILGSKCDYGYILRLFLFSFSKVHHSQTVLLLAAAMVLAHSLEASSYNLANERSSIERTYELTKYLEHQLKEIKDTYVRNR